MMQPNKVSLADLLFTAGVPPLDILGDAGALVSGISTHAQRTAQGEMFVATRGTSVDSHLLLGEAVLAGAGVLLVDRDTPGYRDVTVVRVADTRHALGLLAHAYFGNPAQNMKVAGVTGTNGKTSTATLIHHIAETAGARAGVIGTLGTRYCDVSLHASTTTPGPLELARVFAAMQAARVEVVAMEVSSHGIHQGRIAGIPFRAGALTNITQDHLDYHGTMEAYAACKHRFFLENLANSPGGIAAFNMDDTHGAAFFASYPGEGMAYSRGPNPRCFVHARDLDITPRGIEFSLVLGNKMVRVRSCLVGAFNLSNMLAAAACAHGMGISAVDIAQGLSTARPVPGRFECIDEGQPFTVIVDYAHTPDALERVLKTARRHCAGRLITVFGCGGDRDRGKRPLMGKAAGDDSDFVIVTSDNPRNEDPTYIAAQAVEGVLVSALRRSCCHVVLDRAQAIDQALNMACPGDAVVIAGKGHEDYQDVGTTRLPFDDRLVARHCLRQMLASFHQPIHNTVFDEQVRP